MALFVEHPVYGSVFTTGGIALNMGRRAQVIKDEFPQMIGVVSRIRDDMPDASQPFDQPARLWAITPLPRCDRKPNGQAERVNCCMYLGGQATFGTANTGSFKPPF